MTILGEARASCTGGVSDWGVSLPSGAILVALPSHWINDEPREQDNVTSRRGD